MIKHNVVKSLSERDMRSLLFSSGHMLFDEKANEKLKIGISKKLRLSGPENVSILSSGSLGLWLALKVFSPETIDLPFYCCPSINNACQLASSNSEFHDCAHHSVNVKFSDPNSKNYKIVVHNFGYSSTNCITKNNLIINDLTHLFGSESLFDGTMDNALFNFASAYATKPFTTGGQGGIIWSTDKQFITEVECALNHTDPQKGFINGRITSFQAEYGLEALQTLSSDYQKRRDIAEQYGKILAGSQLEFSRAEDQNEFYRFIISVPNLGQALGIFAAFGIEVIRPIDANEFHKPISLFPNSQKNLNTLLSIPCYPSLTRQQISKVQNALGEILDKI